jgi:RNA polymerase sigma-70 factor (ECF subfamily)
VNSHHKSEQELQRELQQINAARENPQAFNVLYEKYFKSIYVFIYRRTLNEELAADITSQVFLRALINIKKYEFKGLPFSSWLFRIAFNEINMHFRKHKTDRTVSIEQSGVHQLIQETETGENTESIQLMTKAIQKLESEDIYLIELRFFEQRSFAEVAEIVGITENNAKVKVYRILDKLKRLMNIKFVG